jgi:formylglycine-generating enzyme required for sulfatase activity
MKKIPILVGAAALCALGMAGYFGVTKMRYNRDLQALHDKTLETLVYVEGGSFQTGNYRTDFLYPSGRRADILVSDFVVPPSRDVTLNSFYVAAFEPSYAEFNLFLKAQGYPALKVQEALRFNLPDQAASMSLEEATNYCAWLGDLTGVSLRLPTEAEWEYVARSRGLTPVWATDDGNFRPGENVRVTGDRDTTRAEMDPPIGAFPPNPLGVYDLPGGLYEWVSDRAPSDPEGVGIYKGGSNDSTIISKTIPDRGVAGRISEEGLKLLLDYISEDMAERISRQKDPRGPNPGNVTARCVADETRPPVESGFGQMPGPVSFSPPFYAKEQ